MKGSDTFLYFSAWLVLTTALRYYDITQLEFGSERLGLLAILSLGVSVIGLWGCYAANGARDGRNLTERFVTIALPLTVQITVISEAIYWALFFIYPFVTEQLTDSEYANRWGILDNSISLSMFVIWYLAMAWHLRSIAIATQDLPHRVELQ